LRLLGGATASAAPVPAIGQQSGRIYRLAFLIPVARHAPAVVAFLDELRANGFAGENLEILPRGSEVRNKQIGPGGIRRDLGCRDLRRGVAFHFKRIADSVIGDHIP
jgi:hypothetical protein